MDISTPTTGGGLTGYAYTATRPCDCTGCAYRIEPGNRAYRLLDTKDGDTVALDYHAACQYGPRAVSA